MFKTLKEIGEVEARKIIKNHTEGYWLGVGGHGCYDEPIDGEFIFTFRGRDWGIRKTSICGRVVYEKGPMQY